MSEALILSDQPRGPNETSETWATV